MCVALFLLGCKPTHRYDKNIRELDSLKIVMEQAVINFKEIDSLECYNAVSRQKMYHSFIIERVTDTLSNAEAKALQLFFTTKQPLNDFINKRQYWLNEASNAKKQLSNLTTDLKNDVVEPDDAVDFINREKTTSEKTIDELKLNTVLVGKHLQVYHVNLPVVETLIKKRNDGKSLD